METWGKVLLVVENHFKWLQIGYKHWLIPGPINTPREDIKLTSPLKINILLLRPEHSYLKTNNKLWLANQQKKFSLKINLLSIQIPLRL